MLRDELQPLIQQVEGQESLFGDDLETALPKKVSTNIEDFTPHEKLAFEKEYLGLYLTSHPQMNNLMSLKIYISHEIEILTEEKEGAKVRVGGIIEASRKIFTKKTGSEMAFLTIENEKGMSVDCIVFPKVFERHKHSLIKDSVIIIEGKLDTKNDKPTIIAEKISQVVKFSS